MLAGLQMPLLLHHQYSKDWVYGVRTQFLDNEQTLNFIFAYFLVWTPFDHLNIENI